MSTLEKPTKIRTRMWHAGFEGEEKVTDWYRSKDKPWSIMRQRSKERRGNPLSIRSQPFIEKLDL